MSFPAQSEKEAPLPLLTRSPFPAPAGQAIRSRSLVIIATKKYSCQHCIGSTDKFSTAVLSPQKKEKQPHIANIRKVFTFLYVTIGKEEAYMFVANCMTKNPVTISPDAGIDEASKLMDKGHFRRLPVVEHGKLVGFFTNRDLLRASPSTVTTLDRYEMHTLLAKIKVADVMQKNVITVTDTMTIEEAALIMEREKISGIPVLSSAQKLVGIISSTDIFRAFIAVMGLDSGKTRLTIDVADRKGVLRDISTVLADLDISIDSMVTLPQPNGTYQIIIRADIDDVETVKERLWAKGFTVSHVIQIG